MSTVPPVMPTRRAAHAAVGLVVIAAFVIVILRNAWMCDDAFITLRTVDNALHGLGLRWNPAERVQTYTHPLWMALLLPAHALTGEPYYGTLAVAVGTSALAIGALWWGAHELRAGLLAVLPLLLSKAFVDFSTSGLENPLAHLWIAALALSAARGDRTEDLGRTALLTWSAALVRPDLLVLAAPCLLLHVGRVGLSWRALGAVGFGAAPLLGWELFSLVYYGALVPNTALAKLGGGLPRDELVAQGIRYLQWSASYDLVTVLALGIGLGVLGWGRDGVGRALAAGAALYLGWVVWIGGDFMGGRFLTAPLFALATGLARRPVGPLSAGLAGLGILGVGLGNPYAPVWSGKVYERAPSWRGITDERGYYHPATGLLAGAHRLRHNFAQQGRRARKAGPHTAVRTTVGFFGYMAGPEVHVVDPLGLGDPLLSRLPPKYDPRWRIGHLHRAVPEGYDPGQDQPPADPGLAALYEQVRQLTRGPLADPGRLWTALDLTVRPPALDPWPLRFPELVRADRPLPARPDREPQPVGPGGLALPVQPPRAVAPRVVVQRQSRWQVLYVRDQRVLAEHTALGAGPNALPPSPGPVDQILFFPAIEQGTRSLRAVDLGRPPG